MSRYIDADKMIVDLLTVDPEYEPMIRWCYDAINAQPSADVVKVVRCKDCKFWDSDCRWCDLWGNTQEYYDGYCNYGERKDNE